jgi:uncharacterized DUF497 family protein
MRFEWDRNKAASNKARHGVSFEDGEEVFFDPDAMELYDLDHSQNEDRYKRIGMSQRGILLVVYTVRDPENVYRLISVRKASAKERRDYEQNRED